MDVPEDLKEHRAADRLKEAADFIDLLLVVDLVDAREQQLDVWYPDLGAEQLDELAAREYPPVELDAELNVGAGRRGLEDAERLTDQPLRRLHGALEGRRRLGVLARGRVALELGSHALTHDHGVEQSLKRVVAEDRLVGVLRGLKRRN